MTLLSTIATAVRGGYRVPLSEHRRRIAAAAAERKASGRWTGRPPYGYVRRFVEIDGRRLWADHLEVDLVTAPIVRWIFAEALRGASGRGIAEGLNGDGVPSWTGGHWTHDLVSRLIRNPTYVGRWGAPRLIDPEIAALLQRWPRPRRPLEPPTEWARYIAAMSPVRLAEFRRRNRERARRRRNAHASTPTEHKGDTTP